MENILEFEEINVKPEENKTEPVVEPGINNGVVTLNVTDNKIAELKGYMELTVADVNDTKGYDLIYEKHQEIKQLRAGAVKWGKELRSEALKIQKMVVSEEKRVLDELDKIGDHLQAQRDIVENEKFRLKELAEQQEAEKLQNRIDILATYNVSAPVTALKLIDDAGFELVRANAEKQFKEAQEAEAEKLRLEQEAADKLKKEQEEQAEALRLQQEAFKKEQEEAKAKQDKIDADNERIRQEQKAAQDKIDAQLKDIQDKKDEAERVRLQAVKEAELKEEARLQALQEIEDKKAADEKAEADKKAQEAKELALRPDREKLKDFSKVLSLLVYPELSTPEAKAALEGTKVIIDRGIMYLEKQLKTL